MRNTLKNESIRRKEIIDNSIMQTERVPPKARCQNSYAELGRDPGATFVVTG